MKRVELLSPVGDMEMLYAAIHNGADAVYLAGKSYGARKYARNFTNEELIEVIQYAHLYGVRVYVTVNTIIYEREFDDCLNYIDFLYQHQIDALIMQDIGLISIVRKKYPNMEIHASTQCHNHNYGGLKMFHDMGVTRVVLDRELSIDEIRDIDVPIEKEVFVYGALCVCYSGCCLFSSMNGGRSGNRGECAQCCRLPYKEIRNGKVIDNDGDYLLSTKDLNALNYLPMLIDAGIDSFKIEGRMKSPSYVGYVTRCARRIIDGYYQKENLVLSEEELTNLKKLFYRGFTNGYLLGSQNIMNIKSPNHQGVPIGEVIGYKDGKVKVRLSNDYLYQGDGIRFLNADVGMRVNRLYNNKGLLVRKCNNGDVLYLDVRDHIRVGDVVLKTIDSLLQESILNYDKKKIPVKFRVISRIGKKLRIEISDFEASIYEEGDIVEESVSSSISRDDFIKQLKKLGNTPFSLSDIDIELDSNAFVRLSVINEMRRNLVDRLVMIRKSRQVHEVVYGNIDERQLYLSKTSNKKISVLVRNREQLDICLKYQIDTIYVDDYLLYKEYKNYNNVYYRVSRVNNKMNKFHNERLLVGDMGSGYVYSHDNDVIGDYFLNVVNSYSVHSFKDLGFRRVCLSVELKDYDIEDIVKYIEDKSIIEMVIYGRVELMILKVGHSSILMDKNHHKYPVIDDGNITHIYQYEVMDNINDINKYNELGIEYFRLDFLDESGSDIETILNKVI